MFFDARRCSKQLIAKKRQVRAKERIFLKLFDFRFLKLISVGIRATERTLRAKIANRREANRNAGIGAEADDAQFPEFAAATEAAFDEREIVRRRKRTARVAEIEM